MERMATIFVNILGFDFSKRVKACEVAQIVEALTSEGIVHTVIYERICIVCGRPGDNCIHA